MVLKWNVVVVVVELGVEGGDGDGWERMVGCLSLKKQR